jgi:hypothetical protein
MVSRPVIVFAVDRPSQKVPKPTTSSGSKKNVNRIIDWYKGNRKSAIRTAVPSKLEGFLARMTTRNMETPGGPIPVTWQYVLQILYPLDDGNRIDGNCGSY